MDALADAADGLGGGWTRDDVLRIMRDHAIGSYGGVALVLLIVLKVTTIASLVPRPHMAYYLILAPSLGRWSIVPLSKFLPYAGESKAGPAEKVGTTELIWATVLAAGITALVTWRGFACWGAVAIVTTWFGRFCFRKIGGVTGDTLGANIEICECVVLLLGLAMP
jgi:cobalamin synthase